MMWRSRIFQVGAPPAIAASTKGCSRTLSTTERTSRTTRGISGMVIAMMTTRRLARDSETIAMASRMAGIAISPSMIRMTMASAVRKKPASRPIVSPTRIEKVATERPTSSETRAPYTSRAKTSRPRLSVPSQFWAEGGRSRCAGCISSGSPAISGANRATVAITARIKSPAARVGLRRMKRHGRKAGRA